MEYEVQRVFEIWGVVRWWCWCLLLRTCVPAHGDACYNMLGRGSCVGLEVHCKHRRPSLGIAEVYVVELSSARLEEDDSMVVGKVSRLLWRLRNITCTSPRLRGWGTLIPWKAGLRSLLGGVFAGPCEDGSVIAQGVLGMLATVAR